MLIASGYAGKHTILASVLTQNTHIAGLRLKSYTAHADLAATEYVLRHNITS